MRIDRYLAESGTGSRSGVKNLIRSGRVTVNGNPVKNAGLHVDPDRDSVCLDGRPVIYTAFEYYMLNKPAGILSASSDRKEKTVVDLITDAKRTDLFPAGRLDRDTEGLLLITNDGALSHRLLSPKNHVDKTYFVRLARSVTQEDIDAFANGLIVDDTLTAMPASLVPAGETEAEVTLHEGKFHQVKRMFEAVGNEVLYLKRLRMGPLTLDAHLAPGAYRPLNAVELRRLHVTKAASVPAQTRAIIFDLDGTLVDSMWLWRQIDIDYLARFGIPMPDDLQEAISGISITQTALYFRKRFGITDDTDTMIRDWNAMALEKYMHEVPPKPGVLRFLTAMKQKGIRLAVATSNSRQLTAAVLNALSISDLFDCVLTGEDIHRGKPDPDIYLETAALLKEKPENCLVFEDLVPGIQAALAAGMRCIAVEDDFSSDTSVMKQALADDWILDYNELCDQEAI